MLFFVTGGDLSAFQQDCGRIMNHRVDSKQEEKMIFKPYQQEERHR